MLVRHSLFIKVLNVATPNFRQITNAKDLSHTANEAPPTDTVSAVVP